MSGSGLTAKFLLPAFVVLAVCGCGQHASDANGATAAAGSGADVALPRPAANGGSVTGMPSRPGPNPVGSAVAAAAETDLPGAATVDPPDAVALDPAADVAVDAAAGDAADKPPTPPIDVEPSAQDAVGVLQDYYAAINRRDYPRAWSSWSDGGRSSGQTLQQFADGFANTAQVAVQPGTPGRVEGAAGSRYVEIPVAIQATQTDGTMHRYTGTYTLRRAVVDGATAAQRAWHIGSAALHEAR